MIVRFLKFADAVAWVASVLARIMLIAVAASLFVQVILRFGFSFSLPWPEEASRYLMIWVVMLTASLLVKDNELVRVDFLDALWPKRLLVFRNALFRVFLAVLFVVMAYYGWEQAAFSIKRPTAALQISWFWPYLSIPVGSLLILLQIAAITIRELSAGEPVPTHLSELQDATQ